MNLNKRHYLYIVSAAVLATVVAGRQVKPPVVNTVETPNGTIVENGTPICNPSFWEHTYAGDPRKFKTPQDRLKVLNPCMEVTGTIIKAKPEADGDFHIQLDVDPQFKDLLNEKNMSGQKGYLVLEPVCEVLPITQKDTIAEGVCVGYSGHIFNKSMIGKHVSVTGPYVEDQEHGWREVHPVVSISIIQ